MGHNNFSIKEAIRFGWDTMKANVGFFIALLIEILSPLIGLTTIEILRSKAKNESASNTLAGLFWAQQYKRSSGNIKILITGKFQLVFIKNNFSMRRVFY